MKQFERKTFQTAIKKCSIANKMNVWFKKIYINAKKDHNSKHFAAHPKVWVANEKCLPT